MDLNVLVREFGHDIGRIATALETIARNSGVKERPLDIDLETIVSKIGSAGPVLAPDHVTASLLPEQEVKAVIAAFNQGSVEPSTVPIAYERDRTPVPGSQPHDDSVLVVVRELVAAGTTTYMGIAKALNSRDVKTKMGADFYAWSVRSIMLRNGMTSSISVEALSRPRPATRKSDAADQQAAHSSSQDTRERVLVNAAQPALAAEQAPVKTHAPDIQSATETSHPADLENMLSAKTRSRAQFVRTFGSKKLVGQSDVDVEAAMADFLARGGSITKCRSTTDSSGWDHHNQKQVS